MRGTFRNYFYYTFCTLVVLFNQVCAYAESTSPRQRLECEVGCSEIRSDDVWLISTRHLGCEYFERKGGGVDLRIQRSLGKGEWVEATLDDFLNSPAADQPTLFYVHGNRVNSSDAIRRGWDAYHGLLDCSHSPPTRFVIWSWPSDAIKGVVRDVRAKAARTYSEAHYLAWMLGQLDSRTPVSIIGYSLGARVTSGALHVLSGGELAGSTLPPDLQRPSGSARVALLAAALHNNWLQLNGCHELAVNQMERLLIQYNSCDVLLKRYRVIEKRGRPAALGYTGMYDDGSLGIGIEQQDVCPIVGKSHAEVDYFHSPTIMEEARQVLLDW